MLGTMSPPSTYHTRLAPRTSLRPSLLETQRTVFTSINLAMALCGLCRGIDLIKLGNKDGERFQHHKSHKDLLVSRDLGCPLCALFVDAFRQGMDHPGQGTGLRLEPYSIYSQREPFHNENAKYLSLFNVSYSNIMAGGGLNVYADEGRVAEPLCAETLQVFSLT
jgi:hypothetical protein